ncbi:uncharacterized protein [Panulirus ornatus]|uniref:uncharacterized protein isoform X3 n=1 Tax=Panulirus ornatus TaxID=150431 RepID=UPI003A84BEC5
MSSLPEPMTPPPNVTSDPSEGTMSEGERLMQTSHMLDVTVWLLIFSIFTFFFIIIVATLCMQWVERRREELRGESLLLPSGPVPGYITVIVGSQPHIRLVGHYQIHPFHYGATDRFFSAPRTFVPSPTL